MWKSKFYRAFVASRRPPRHRRDACSIAWLISTQGFTRIVEPATHFPPRSNEGTWQIASRPATRMSATYGLRFRCDGRRRTSASTSACCSPSVKSASLDSGSVRSADFARFAPLLGFGVRVAVRLAIASVQIRRQRNVVGDVVLCDGVLQCNDVLFLRSQQRREGGLQAVFLQHRDHVRRMRLCCCAGDANLVKVAAQCGYLRLDDKMAL